MPHPSAPVPARLPEVIREMLMRRELSALVLCSVVLGLAYAFVMPFASLFFTEEVGLSPWQFAAYMIATHVSGIVVSTFLSRRSDTRYSRKSLMVVAGALGALSYAGFALARDPWMLFLIGSLPLAVSGVCFSQIFALGRDLLARSGLPAVDVPIYMNVFRIGFAVAWAGGPAVSSFLLRFQGFEGAYFGAALLFLAFTLLVARSLPSLPPDAARLRSSERLPFREALRVPGLAAFFTGFAFYSCASTLGMMNLPLLIVKTLGGHEGEVGWAYSIAPVFEIPFMYLAGVWATRTDMAVIIRLTMAVAALYYAGLSWVAAPWQVYPLQILSAAIVAVNSGIAITFFQNFLPGWAGTSTNLYANANRIGSLAGFLAFGAVAGPFGHRAVFALCAALSAASLVCVLLAARPDAADGSTDG